MINWTEITEIYPNFTSELQKKWETKGFTAEETKEWIEGFGLKPEEADFADWLKKKYNIKSEEFLGDDDMEELREKYKKTAQGWLDANYPKEERENIKELYINKEGLEGKLDLSSFPNLEKIFISHFVDENKLEIKDIEKYKDKIIKLVNAQEWLENQEEYNTKEKREKITDLYISESEEDLEGKLDLTDFVNLTNFDCSNNKLTGLNISNCSELTELKFSGNQLGEIDLRNAKKLVKLSCQNNRLTNLDLSNCESLKILEADNWEKGYKNFNELSNIDFLEKIPNPEKLEVLHLHANNINNDKDLTPFSRFVNLEELDLGLNGFSEEFTKERGNKFSGSLEPLKNLSKLKNLDIGNTDIESGLEHLPDSIKRLNCSVKERPESKVKEIRKQLAPYNYDIKIWKEWKERDIDSEGIVQLMEAGVKVNDYDFANYLKKVKEHELSNLKNSNIEKLEKEYEEYCQVQTWLDFKYPNKEASSLNINKKNLKGSLEIKGWKNLEELDCSNYRGDKNDSFPEITLSDLPKLKFFFAKNCGLCKLEVSDCIQIRKLSLSGNFLNDLNFLESLDNKKLTNLSISVNEYLSKKLPSLNKFKNLERLDIFTEDIDSSELERYLPNSIKIYYLNREKKEKETKKKEVKEWLNNKYDGEKRSEFKKLDISNEFLEGELDLSDYVDLEELDCSNNYLTSINLKNNEKLNSLNLTNNNFPEQDLSNLSHLINLEFLSLGNTNKGEISDSIYNRFIGSLKHLKKLSKLKVLNISNTDIDSGLEYLSDSLEEIVYSAQSRPKAKVNSIKKEIESYVSTTIREKRKKHWLTYGPKREEELEEEISILKTELKMFKDSYFSLWSVDEEKIGDEAKKIISNTKNLYIGKKQEELDKLADTLDRRDKYLLELLSSLNDFKQIKAKFLQEKLGAENKKRFDLVQEDLKQLKVIEEKENVLISEKEELKIKRSELKAKLEELLAEAKDKLNEESQFLLETMLEMQVEIADLGGNRRKQEKLNKLKSLLAGKGINVESICRKHEEVAKLEEILKWLEPSLNENQAFQSQIEIFSKYSK